MPLTKRGKKIKHNMEKEYGPEKGEDVFFAMENSGKLPPRCVAQHRTSKKSVSGKNASGR